MCNSMNDVGMWVNDTLCAFLAKLERERKDAMTRVAVNANASRDAVVGVANAVPI